MHALIKTNDLTKRYKMGREELIALNRVNLAFEEGEFTGLIGPSGSGKTTFLNLIGALDKPSEGEATVLGYQIENLKHKEAAQLRNEHIGFIFQTFNLLPVYTVYENVEFPLLLQTISSSNRRRMVMQALDWVGLTDKAGVRPNRLSGGQCQRVAIARAMVKQPEIVLADEPTANLDAENCHHILQTMAQLNKELKTTFIFSTHDEKVIEYLHRKITLADGKVIGDVRQGGH